MDNSEGIWVSQTITSPLGNCTVSLRLDTAIDPETMWNRLEKESIEMNKNMDKLLAKLDSFSDKTPQKIVDSTMKEILNLCQLQTINMNESFKWSKAWEIKDYENALQEMKKSGSHSEGEILFYETSLQKYKDSNFSTY